MIHTNFTLKDLTDISTKIDICNFADEYKISAYTNALEGEVNGYIRIDSCEAQTLGKSCLFCIRSGMQLCCEQLDYDEQLRIPDSILAHIRESLSVEIEVFGQKRSVWRTTIEKMNALHANDKTNNYTIIPVDLPVPEFKYYEKPKKETFISKLKSVFKKEKDKEANK